MKKLLYGLLAILLFGNFSFAQQLMSDQAHKTMIDDYTTNLNDILTANCPAGKSINQYKRDLINGTNIPSDPVKNSIINNALQLKNYGYQFALKNGLTANDDNHKYFYGAFAPSTIIKNGKLAFSGSIGGKMWSCVLSNFVTDNCGPGILISDNNDLTNLATTSINQVTQRSSRGYEILIMIGSFSDCIYNKLGHQLNNPYTTANMQIAFDNIKSNKGGDFLRNLTDFSIQTTHLYVKVEPKDELEESQLLNDTLQEFSDYPLDYEFPEEMAEEVSVIDEKGIGVYYVSVPVGYVFPTGIQTTVLDELYIPEEDSYFENMEEPEMYNPDDIASKNDFFNNLLLEAFTITGNGAEWDWQIPETGRVRLRLSARKWFPSGNIQVYDNTLLRAVNLEGVKVYVRHWFRTRTGITKVNGNYSTKGIRGKSRYFIKWKRYEFALREGLSGLAKTAGPKLRNQQWNTILGKINRRNNSPSYNERDIYFATVFQGVHDYYYGKTIDSLDLAKPHHNTSNRAQLKISLFPSNTRSVTIPQLNVFGLLPTIYIFELGSTSERIYGTAVHEMTHAAHYDIPNSNFKKLEWEAYISPEALVNYATGNMSTIQRGCGKIMESWAACVETALTNDRYNRLGEIDYKYEKIDGIAIDGSGIYICEDDQQKILGENDFYTSTMYDLYDDFNQKVKISPDLPNDNVTGFTLKEIQDIVLQSNSWDDLKTNCKTKHPELNTQDIDDLLNYWN